MASEGSCPHTQAPGKRPSPQFRTHCPLPSIFLFDESCVCGLKGRVIPARKSLESSAWRQPLKAEKTQPQRLETQVRVPGRPHNSQRDLTLVSEAQREGSCQGSPINLQTLLDAQVEEIRSPWQPLKVGVRMKPGLCPLSWGSPDTQAVPP